MPTEGPIELEIPEEEYGMSFGEDEDEEGNVKDARLSDERDGDVDSPLVGALAAELEAIIADVGAVVPGATFCPGLPSLRLIALV